MLRKSSVRDGHECIDYGLAAGLLDLRRHPRRANGYDQAPTDASFRLARRRAGVCQNLLGSYGSSVIRRLI